MAAEILPLCFLFLYISGTYSSTLDKLKYANSSVLHQEQPKNDPKDTDLILPAGKLSVLNKRKKLTNVGKENAESTAAQEETSGTIEIDKYTTNNSTDMLFADNQSLTTSEIPQYSLEVKAETSNNSTTFLMDKTAHSVIDNTSESISISHQDSNQWGVVPSTTSSLLPSTGVTHSSVTQIASNETTESGTTNATETNLSKTNLVTTVYNSLKHSKSGRSIANVTCVILIGVGLPAVSVLIAYKKCRQEEVPEDEVVIL